MIIIPKNISYNEWANNLYIDLPSLNIPLAESEENWKEWAQRLIDINQLVNVPLPNIFPTWNIWAEYFVISV
jgi:hypothetical protein